MRVKYGWAIVHAPSGEVLPVHDSKGEARMLASQDQKLWRLPRGVLTVRPTLELVEDSPRNGVDEQPGEHQAADDE